jgi:hypothetical protein
MKHVENRIFLNSDDLFIGTPISFYHRENLDTGANYSLLLPKYLYIYFFLLLSCVHVCTTVHIVYVQFTTFSLWFFLLRKSKNSKKHNRKFFFMSFFCQLLFSEQARNMFISNHHPMACMSMTSQMMIFFSLNMNILACFSLSLSLSLFENFFLIDSSFRLFIVYSYYLYFSFLCSSYLFFLLSFVRLFYLIFQPFVVIYLLFTWQTFCLSTNRKV